MNKIIVLITGGKNEDFYTVGIMLFDTIEEAEKFCKENTDNPMDEKYWRYCEIIESGIIYEPTQYKNYKHEI